MGGREGSEGAREGGKEGIKQRSEKRERDHKSEGGEKEKSSITNSYYIGLRNIWCLCKMVYLKLCLRFAFFISMDFIFIFDCEELKNSYGVLTADKERLRDNKSTPTG